MSKFLLSILILSISLYSFGNDNEQNKQEDTTDYTPNEWFSSLDKKLFYHYEGPGLSYISEDYGYIRPRTSFGYTGITVHDAKTKEREYLISRLLAPMKAGEKYNVQFYVCLSPHSYYWVDHMGIDFSTIPQKHGAVLNSKSSVISNDYHNLARSEWHKVSGVYVANGGEQYIAIGAFNDFGDKMLDESKEENLNFAHYYIEDVIVKPANDSKASNLVANASFEDHNKFDTDVKIEEPEVVEVEEAMPEEEFKDVEIVVLEDIKIEEVKVDQKIVLNNITFETNKATLLDASYNELASLIDILNKNPNLQIKITGHTDNTGSEMRNKELSQQRAQSVVTYLVSKGIVKERLDAEGHGSDEPVRSNKTEEGRSLNRRVEFTVVKL